MGFAGKHAFIGVPAPVPFGTLRIAAEAKHIPPPPPPQISRPDDPLVERRAVLTGFQR